MFESLTQQERDRLFARPDTVCPEHARTAAACRQVPELPARDPFEGLQAILLVHLAIHIAGYGYSVSIRLPDHILAPVVGPGAVGFHVGHPWGIDTILSFSVSRGPIAKRQMADAFRETTRGMPVCLAMGEAAGLAATNTAASSVPDVHALSTDLVQARLREVGAYLS